MLEYKDLERNKKYELVKGPMKYAGATLICLFESSYGAIFVTDDERCAGTIARHTGYKYELIFTSNECRFIEVSTVKDKRWITQQLIAMI